MFFQEGQGIIIPLFSRAFVARWWRVPWVQGARRKMDEGVLSVRPSHFSSCNAGAMGLSAATV